MKHLRAKIFSFRIFLSKQEPLSVIAMVLQILFLLALTVFNFYVFNTPKISTGNSAARVLLAVGTLFEIGTPYVDLFEYVPPGLLIVLSSWIELFGISMISLRSLHALLIFCTGLLLLLVMKKTFRFWLAEIAIFIPLTLAVFSPSIQTDIFSIELFGVFFALAGLTAVLYVRGPVSRLALGSGLLLAASQIKETYTLCAATMLVAYGDVLRKNSFRSSVKFFLMSLYGPITVIILIVSYIVLHDAVQGYSYVIKEKITLVQHVPLAQIIKNLREIMIYYPTMYLNRITVLWELVTLSGVIFLQALVIRIFTVRKFWAISIDQIVAYCAVFLFSFGILGGFMIYGQISPGIRMLSVGISLFLLLGIVISPALHILTESITRPLPRALTQVVLAISLIFILLPNYSVRRDYVWNVAPPTKYDFFIENKIIQRVSADECILHIYGWEVSQSYIYTRRKPCTQFFLANLVVGRPTRVKIYQDEILTHPPAAIIYNTGGSDLNVTNFENEIINFTEVIKQCYVLDPEVHQYFGYFFAPVDLYWKKNGLSKTQFINCYKNFGLPVKAVDS